MTEGPILTKHGMNFTQLVNAVYTETNRPDLVAETQQAVLASTLKMHGWDFWKKDINSGLVVFDSAAYIQTIDTINLPFYKAIHAIRKWDPSFNTTQLNPTILPPITSSLGIPVNADLALGFLKWLDPDDILDEYAQEKVDVAYQIGGTIYIKSSTSVSQARVFWYQFPNLDATNNYANWNSWISQEYPYAIVFDAASAILQKIGMTDAARKYDYVDPRGNNHGLVQGILDIMTKANVTVRGY